MISVLTSSRFGLCEHEIEHLCQQHAPSASKNNWSKLAYFLAPFLKRVTVSGFNLISWRDSRVGRQMARRYLADQQTRRHVHALMLQYFQLLWDRCTTELHFDKLHESASRPSLRSVYGSDSSDILTILRRCAVFRKYLAKLEKFKLENRPSCRL